MTRFGGTLRCPHRNNGNHQSVTDPNALAVPEGIHRAQKKMYAGLHTGYDQIDKTLRSGGEYGSERSKTGCWEKRQSYGPLCEMQTSTLPMLISRYLDFDVSSQSRYEIKVEKTLAHSCAESVMMCTAVFRAYHAPERKIYEDILITAATQNSPRQQHGHR